MLEIAIKDGPQNSLPKQCCNALAINGPDVWTNIFANPSIRDSTAFFQLLGNWASNTEHHICLDTHLRQCGVAVPV
eukprot:11275605-Ditylum_brightwellii.AAC.1